MLRKLALLVTTAGAAVAVAISLANPAAAAPPSQSDEHDCRVTAVCNPGQHLGWDHHRRVRDMRRRLALLMTSAALALGAAVVVASPAEARNIGGSVPAGAICVRPGQATVGSPNSGLPCLCVVLPDGSVARIVGKGPNTACPPGILGLH